MSLPNISNFIAYVIDRHNGPAKSERYYVHINPPAALNAPTFGLSLDLVYQCETSELPGTTLATVDYRVIGPSRKIATLTGYNDITLQFYCTNDFYEKPFFDTWIEYINPRNLGWDFRYKNEYSGNIEILQVDLTGAKIIYGVRLINAFPITTTPMPLHWGGDSPHLLAVTFAYDRYEPIVTFNNMFVSALTTSAPYNNGLNLPLSQPPSQSDLQPENFSSQVPNANDGTSSQVPNT